MSQPDDLLPHNSDHRGKGIGKHKKFPDETVLTIHMVSGTVRQFAFYQGSPFKEWWLSPRVISPKDTLTIWYENGERIHFPLCNVESYHVAPRERTSHCELSGDYSCPQPMDKPAARCELCAGCLDPKHHPAPSVVKGVTDAETTSLVHN